MVTARIFTKTQAGRQTNSTRTMRLFALVGAMALASPCHSFQSSQPRPLTTPTRSGIDRSSSRDSSVVSPKSPTTTTTTTTSLNALPAVGSLASLGSSLGSVGVLAAVILVHEGGHFLAARSLGIDVAEFSVGIGPRLIGVKRTVVDGNVVLEWNTDDTDADDSETEIPEAAEGDKGIEFSLRAIPLGGYVRFPENYDREVAFKNDDVVRRARNEARRMRLETASAVEKWAEITAARSFLLNALTLGLLTKWAGRRFENQLKQAEEEVRLEGESSTRGAAATSTSQWWNPFAEKNVDESDDADFEYSAASRLEVLQSAVTPEVDYFSDPNLLQNRPWPERALVLSGGVIFNIILAFALYFGEVTSGKGLPQPMFDAGVVISSIGPESSSYGLLQRGDIILGVNDVATSQNTDRKGMFESQDEISGVIAKIRETPEGETVRLTIVHGPNAAGATTAKNNPEIIAITPRPRLDTLGQPSGPPSIGVMLAPNYVGTDMIKATSLADGASKAGSAVYEITSQTAKSLLGFLGSMLSGKGMPAGTTMSGPIGVIKSGAQVVSSSDVAAVVAFAAAISVNLAVINSLPLPALDGGQLMFVLAEAVAGRKIDQRLQEGINAGALIILLVISAGTAIGDVTSLVSR